MLQLQYYPMDSVQEVYGDGGKSCVDYIELSTGIWNCLYNKRIDVKQRLVTEPSRQIQSAWWETFF